jgi:protein-L-isoaspartate(D-aspartate) O-methyltransferase
VQRQRMVDRQLVDITDTRVREAMGQVPRHLFVEPVLQSGAYEDRPLPIGLAQTISQPWIVARMTQLLELTGSETVLEIGTGSGYQAAVLARLCKRVFTIERHGELAQAARKRLSEMDIHNVTVLVADGTLGRSDYGPFDAILVTAGAPAVPKPLTGQLVPNGRLVIPVGDADAQTLVRVTASEGGEAYREERFEACRFVPLLGMFGWKT